MTISIVIDGVDLRVIPVWAVIPVWLLGKRSVIYDDYNAYAYHVRELWGRKYICKIGRI